MVVDEDVTLMKQKAASHCLRRLRAISCTQWCFYWNGGSFFLIAFGRLDTFWNHHVHWVQHYLLFSLFFKPPQLSRRRTDSLYSVLNQVLGSIPLLFDREWVIVGRCEREHELQIRRMDEAFFYFALSSNVYLLFWHHPLCRERIRHSSSDV